MDNYNGNVTMCYHSNAELVESLYNGTHTIYVFQCPCGVRITETWYTKHGQLVECVSVDYRNP